MTKKVLAAFLSGWGFGVGTAMAVLDAYSIPLAVFTLVVFSVSYSLDRRSEPSK